VASILPSGLKRIKNRVRQRAAVLDFGLRLGLLGFRIRFGLGSGDCSRVVSVLDSGAEGPGFKSQSRRCLVMVTVLGKLFTPIVPLFTEQHNW